MKAAAGPATKREIFAWMMFDFANSSYTTVIITAVYAPYFVNAIAAGSGLSREDGEWYWGASVAVSQFFVLISAPVVGAICDFSSSKKRFLFATYVGCVAATFALGWVGPGDLAAGIALLVVSNFFFSSGENLIAAFLPEITTPQRMGLVSGLGWGIGYIGGLLSLVACYAFVSSGIDSEHAETVQWAFIMTALFFLAGGLPTILFLKERAHPMPLAAGDNYVKAGFRRVATTLREVRRHRQLFRFLAIFFVYNIGIFIVIAFSSIYAINELGFSANEVITFFVVVQLSASLGALGFGALQDRLSARWALSLSLVCWLIVCVGAYFTSTSAQFYVVGNIAGIAMGSSQSGARALVGTFSPPERSGEFFGFWGLVWKLSTCVGPLAFSTTTKLVGMRTAVLLTGVTFLVGLIGMCFVDEAAGRREALETPVDSPVRRA